MDEIPKSTDHNNLLLTCGVLALVACLILSLVATAFAVYLAFR